MDARVSCHSPRYVPSGSSAPSGPSEGERSHSRFQSSTSWTASRGKSFNFQHIWLWSQSISTSMSQHRIQQDGIEKACPCPPNIKPIHTSSHSFCKVDWLRIGSRSRREPSTSCPSLLMFSYVTSSPASLLLTCPHAQIAQGNAKHLQRKQLGPDVQGFLLQRNTRPTCPRGP